MKGFQFIFRLPTLIKLRSGYVKLTKEFKMCIISLVRLFVLQIQIQVQFNSNSISYILPHVMTLFARLNHSVGANLPNRRRKTCGDQEMKAECPRHCIQILWTENRPYEQMCAKNGAGKHNCEKRGRCEERPESQVSKEWWSYQRLRNGRRSRACGHREMTVLL